METANRVTVRNVKINKVMSDETLCFSASMYFDGVKVATAMNHGRGGCNFYEAVGAGNDPNPDGNGCNLDDAFAWAEAQTIILDCDWEPGKTIEIVHDKMDHFVDEAISDFETRKWFRRNCKKTTLFRLKSDEQGDGDPWRTMNAPYSKKVHDQMSKKYGDDLGEIANLTRCDEPKPPTKNTPKPRKDVTPKVVDPSTIIDNVAKSDRKGGAKSTAKGDGIMTSKLQTELIERIEFFNGIHGDDHFTIDTEEQFRVRNGKKAPNGQVFRLFESGVEKAVAIGRGSPRKCLDYLNSLEDRPDEMVAAAEQRHKDAMEAVARASAELDEAAENLASAKDRAAEMKVAAKTAEATAKKISKTKTEMVPTDDITKLAKKADKGNGKTKRSKKIKVEDVNTAIVPDDPNVRALFLGDKEIGEISTGGKNKWSVDSPFSPTTHKTLKAAVAAAVELINAK